ncbi:MAG TPA: PEP-CTERM sorting domain-containing protein [Acetobacteraceae bacterium]|nr:PEP-CTERM sorting domain-containing protein [Acetobacteraceae bacterium]
MLGMETSIFRSLLSVTYSYVPEPMSLALLSSGLLGTGLTLRRKRPLRRSLLLLAGRQFRRPLRPANGRDQR